jgi:hypothetical protein
VAGAEDWSSSGHSSPVEVEQHTHEPRRQPTEDQTRPRHYGIYCSQIQQRLSV